MNMLLSPIELRVLGCLIEKEMATPEYYPLTLNALVNACNQKSNRYPVMELETSTVEAALYALRTEFKLAIEVTSSGSRVPKYKHNMQEHWGFSLSKMAILCELFVRGPQTPGDLRSHANRLHTLTDSGEVESILYSLEAHEGGPFVVQLPMEPGKRERRWAHLFGGEPEIPAEPVIQYAPAEPQQTSGLSRHERIEALEKEVAELKQELGDLRTAFEAFKTAFE